MQNARDMKEVDVLFAMAEIRRVLQASPAAADTDCGIHGYWVNWIEPRPDLEVTTEALQRLKKQGEIDCRILEDGGEIWCQIRGKKS